jgi:hypothetical protein
MTVTQASACAVSNRILRADKAQDSERRTLSNEEQRIAYALFPCVSDR